MILYLSSLLHMEAVLKLKNNYEWGVNESSLDCVFHVQACLNLWSSRG